jgi:G:T-mismatch repair DNA endonuclease (very short patch repair protein)
LFGDFWHSKKITGLKKKEHRKQRQAHFAKYGYKTLVIWEHELQNIQRLKRKLVEFNNE